MKKHNNVTLVMAFIVFGFQCAVCLAQDFISFSAKDSKTGSVLQIDSIHVRNTIRSGDTTIFSSSFKIDWPVTTGVEQFSQPERFSVNQNYPNAFGSTTTFQVVVPEAGVLELAVYNIIGRRIASYKNALYPGAHEFMFSTGDLPEGVYMLSAGLNNATATLKLLKIGSSQSGAVEISHKSATELRTFRAKKAGMIDTYTFTGYAAGYNPSTLAGIIPVTGQNYQFSFLPTGSTGISTGSFTDVLQQDVPVTGGTLIVTKAGCPLQGMEIEVSDSSFSTTRTFSVSYAPVLSHSFGANFNPVSPVIRISNGGGYSDSLMVIKIPINIQQNQFAMAFYYDEVTGELEGAPVAALSNTEIWVAVRHLSNAQMKFGKALTGRAAVDFADLIVTAVETGQLSGKITSGFKPGMDDWEFPNFGSYIKPDGHCAGQSIAAMWYYSAKKLKEGAEGLNSRFDEIHTDSMWMDNARGYKLCSVVQADCDWANRANWRSKFEATGTKKFSVDSLHYLSFAYAIKVTGKPQFTEIWGTEGGHAMVVYGVDIARLNIADPNYPGEERSILFDAAAGKFTPYETKQNADGDKSLYPSIGYIGKTSMISFESAAARWKEFEAGTIGTVEPNIFPETQLYYLEGANKILLPDQLAMPASDLIILAECPTCGIQYMEGITSTRFYRENGKFIISSNDNSDGRLIVPSNVLTANNRYGIKIVGKHRDKLGYIDFKWLTISPSLKPNVATINPTEGTAGDLLTINGSNFGTDPSKGEVHLYTSSNDVLITTIVAWDTNRIVVTIPEDAISGKVYVKINGATSEYKINSGHLYFTFKPGNPLLLSVTPDHGYGGDVVTILGKRLGKGLTGWKIVINNFDLFPDHPTEITLWTDSLITIILPKTCVGGNLQLVNWSDPTRSSNIIPFNMDEPAVDGYSPAEGPDQTVVTIAGNNLGGSMLWPGMDLTVGGVRPVSAGWSRTEVKFYAKNSGDIVLTICGKQVVVGYFKKL
jgi:hypothetical protein